MSEGSPTVDRPRMPAGYGLAADAAGRLEWGPVAARLAEARNYWVVTSGPDGAPHAMPVWGLWLDGAVLFSTGRGTRKGRNLAADPRVVVHLESGDDVVVVRGVAAEVRDPAALGRFADAYERKYGIRPAAEPDPDAPVFAVRPRVVLGWRERDFPTSATRWRFPG